MGGKLMFVRSRIIPDLIRHTVENLKLSALPDALPTYIRYLLLTNG